MALSQASTYIPLKQAAERYGIPEKTLLEWEDFEHLRGQAISASEASRRYSELFCTYHHALSQVKAMTAGYKVQLIRRLPPPVPTRLS
jgi:hypothetical protein